ncbi:fatty acid oxidation complex subunit beta [Agromyces sp. Root81]|uniref:thiolase family protein n=1 Tax=Agromyces sp. Root81 TaxID=1736601 RepID=UPI0006F65838|nr:thiolase family protein [Agromyces sp. Root81]KRC62751.1 fatty acid oxidation complex subunit beta [Agromyces sp. Root81]
MSKALILDAARTPRARVRRGGGTLAGLSPAELLAVVLRELTARGLPDDRVDDVIVGVSTVVGEQGGNVGRVAAMHAGWSDAVPAGVVSRLCGSGLDAIASGAAQVRSGGAELVVAAGVESMSRVPMLADRPAFAVDKAAGEATGFVSIGVSADAAAIRAGFSRTQLDEYGVRSQLRASAAPAWESTIPVTTPSGTVLAHDEGARPDTTLESLASLEPLFADDPLWERVERHLGITTGSDRGRHTVGTAPQFADAAAAVVLASEAGAQQSDRTPIGTVLGWGQAAVRSPGLEATVPASRKALDQAGLQASELSVVEVNESFAVTPLLLTRELGLPADFVNAHGGAIAVGHPLGACGGVLVANALDQLRRKGGGYGLVVIPAALGLATAVVIESFA